MHFLVVSGSDSRLVCWFAVYSDILSLVGGTLDVFEGAWWIVWNVHKTYWLLHSMAGRRRPFTCEVEDETFKGPSGMKATMQELSLAKSLHTCQTTRSVISPSNSSLVLLHLGRTPPRATSPAYPPKSHLSIVTVSIHCPFFPPPTHSRPTYSPPLPRYPDHVHQPGETVR